MCVAPLCVPAHEAHRLAVVLPVRLSHLVRVRARARVGVRVRARVGVGVRARVGARARVRVRVGSSLAISARCVGGAAATEASLLSMAGCRVR